MRSYFNSGRQSPVVNRSFPAADAKQLAFVYISHAPVEGPCMLNMNNRFNSRVGQVPYDCTHLCRMEEHILGL